jgi:NADPH:quinone reductase-like Zn-dependent oxidoreductase
MKAIVYHKSGLGDVLKLEEIEKPVPRDDEVLIKVRAASVNPFDYHMLRHPWLRRVVATLVKIDTSSPGRDVAGVVSQGSRLSARTLRSSNRATRCSARALERLPSMRASASQKLR